MCVCVCVFDCSAALPESSGKDPAIRAGKRGRESLDCDEWCSFVCAHSTREVLGRRFVLALMALSSSSCWTRVDSVVDSVVDPLLDSVVDSLTPRLTPRLAPLLASADSALLHLEQSASTRAMYERSLPPEELEHIQSSTLRPIEGEDRCRRRLVHRVFLRHCLSQYLPRRESTSLASIPIARDAYGKPHPAAGSILDARGVRFNMSHTGWMCALAVSCARRLSEGGGGGGGGGGGRGEEGLGLDVEHTSRGLRVLSEQRFVERWLHPLEAAQYKQLGGEKTAVESEQLLPHRAGRLTMTATTTAAQRQREWFLKLWTAKEAVLKATGTGITFASLGQFAIVFSAQGDIQAAEQAKVDDNDEVCFSALSQSHRARAHTFSYSVPC